MSCFAKKLRIALHWEMHGSLRSMAIEQRNRGCPNEIGSFDAKHSPPQTRRRIPQSKSDPSGSTYIGKMPNLQLPCQLTQLVPNRRHTSKFRRLQIFGPTIRNDMIHPPVNRCACLFLFAFDQVLLANHQIQCKSAIHPEW